jgi:hypothetical protein
VKLVLQEDAALGGVVAALPALRAQIVSLAKSEPTLEEVFVELVGRGLEDESTDGADGDRPSPPAVGGPDALHPPRHDEATTDADPGQERVA